jgi:hypothetical protein
MAWEIVMAGGYQTTGETSRRGTNVWPDTGGGWMNGRGDDTMTMFKWTSPPAPGLGDWALLLRRREPAR